jgi:hypothetical protein
MAYFTWKASTGIIGGTDEQTGTQEARTTGDTSHAGDMLSSEEVLRQVSLAKGAAGGRSVTEDSGQSCLKLDTGTYNSVATSFGSYKEQWCQPDATGNVWCITTNEVPPNRYDAPGSILIVST